MGTPAPTVAASPVQIPSPPLVAAAAAAEQQDRQQQEAQQRRPPLVVGGVAQEEDDDGGIRAARDWLDWFYIGSRFAILLGVMYFYSSLPRFMLVTLIVAGIYLYQKAIHQRRVILLNDNAEVNNNNNNNNHGQAEADADRADAAEESVETESTGVVATVQPSGLNISLKFLLRKRSERALCRTEKNRWIISLIRMAEHDSNVSDSFVNTLFFD